MNPASSLTDLLRIALLGARGWFTVVALVGLTLFGLSLRLNQQVEPKAVALAFFLPFIISAITGTVALGAHRARSEKWGTGDTRTRVLLGAFTWNALLGLTAVAVDRLVIHFNLLPRDPFAFPQSVIAVACAAAALALLAIYPRQGLG